MSGTTRAYLAILNDKGRASRILKHGVRRNPGEQYITLAGTDKDAVTNLFATLEDKGECTRSVMILCFDIPSDKLSMKFTMKYTGTDIKSTFYEYRGGDIPSKYLVDLYSLKLARGKY